jgi:hypothetical protein
MNVDYNIGFLSMESRFKNHHPPTPILRLSTCVLVFFVAIPPLGKAATAVPCFRRPPWTPLRRRLCNPVNPAILSPLSVVLLSGAWTLSVMALSLSTGWKTRAPLFFPTTVISKKTSRLLRAAEPFAILWSPLSPPGGGQPAETAVSIDTAHDGRTRGRNAGDRKTFVVGP